MFTQRTDYGDFETILPIFFSFSFFLEVFAIGRVHLPERQRETEKK